jgi:hypothetical protein
VSASSIQSPGVHAGIPPQPQLLAETPPHKPRTTIVAAAAAPEPAEHPSQVAAPGPHHPPIPHTFHHPHPSGGPPPLLLGVHGGAAPPPPVAGDGAASRERERAWVDDGPDGAGDAGGQAVGDPDDPYLDGMFEDEGGFASVSC